MSTRELVVALEGRPVGVLSQDHHLRFRYLPEHLELPAPTPISVAMPLREEAWPQRQVRPWIDGLLPDRREVRERWAARFGVPARNPFALLAQVGRDLPGAVQVAAADELEQVVGGEGELRPVTEQQVGRRLAELREGEEDWAVPGERWSLGGAQAKFALVERGGRWFEALGSAATTHIVKPGVRGMLAQSVIEHVTMTAARAVGLRAAGTRYLEFDGQPAIVVERYDRRVGDGTVVRLHQEDLCQATSTPPEKKYETDGGPGVAAISDLLRARATADDLWRFVEAVAFNYLVGASDAHAKNYSVLLSGRQVRLAPLYDLASSLPYDPADADSDLRKTAMAIGGQRRYGQVTEENWARFTRRAGVDHDAFLERVRDMAADIPDAVSDVIAALPSESIRTSLRERLLDRLPHP